MMHSRYFTKNKLSQFLNSILFNDVELPNELETVESVGHEDSGASVDSFAKESIWKAVEEFYLTKAHPAVSICLRHKGNIILNRSIGYKTYEKDNRQAISVDTPICLFSGSKFIAALLVHKLAEQGLINLDKPISYYIPEFGQNGKRHITIDQLLRHKAGCSNVVFQDFGDVFDHEKVMQTLYEYRPRKSMYQRQAYHAVTGGHILAELVQRVASEPFDAVHSRLFREPMDMKYFTYGVGNAVSVDIAENYCTGMKLIFPANKYLTGVIGYDMADVVAASNSEKFQRALLPAGNLYATAEECSRFNQMLLNGGVYDGKQILAPQTIEKALVSEPTPQFDHSFKMPVRFGSGIMLGGPPMNLFGPDARNAYGHIGFLNNILWADPERDLSVCILTTGKQMLGPHLIPLWRLLRKINLIYSKTNELELRGI